VPLYARVDPGGDAVIAAVAGIVTAARGDGQTLLRCGPVTLELALPISQARELHAGAEAELFTHLHFSSKTDTLRLYGFTSAVARDLFATLISASGVGPKVALALLELGVPGLVAAVQHDDEKALTTVPGVGPKLAKKVLLELKDKVGREFAWAAAAQGVRGTEQSPAAADALDAVVALGYPRHHAEAALTQLRGEQGPALDAFDTAELIRRVLGRLASR
jgi:holliday junction DNA helicase RuvA